MRIFDISLPVREGMTVYPGDGPVSFETLRSQKAGDPYTLTYLHLGAHAGTHLDAPLHFLEDGGGVESVLLNDLIGPCRVIRIAEDVKEVGPSCLREAVDLPCRRLLLRTRNSSLYRLGRFCRDYAYLTPDGAAWLKEAGVRLVGMDYYSVERYGADEAGAHLALLGAGMCLLEGLDLSGVSEGEYLLLALPLRLEGPEGSPVRAVLVQAPSDMLNRWD